LAAAKLRVTLREIGTVLAAHEFRSWRHFRLQVQEYRASTFVSCPLPTPTPLKAIRSASPRRLSGNVLRARRVVRLNFVHFLVRKQK